MYFLFIGILALRYRQYQGCDILPSVILVNCTWIYVLYQYILCVNIYTDFNIPYVSLYLYFLCVQLMFCQDTLYCDTRSFWCKPFPIPEVVFVSMKCFAMGGGGAPKGSKYLCSTPPYVHMYRGGVNMNTFLLRFITNTVSNMYR